MRAYSWEQALLIGMATVAITMSYLDSSWTSLTILQASESAVAIRDYYPNKVEIFAYKDTYGKFEDLQVVRFMDHSFIPYVGKFYNPSNLRQLLTFYKVVRWSWIQFQLQASSDFNASTSLLDFFSYCSKHDYFQNLAFLLVLSILVHATVLFFVVSCLFCFCLIIPIGLVKVFIVSLEKFPVYVEIYFDLNESTDFFTELEPSLNVKYCEKNFRTRYSVFSIVTFESFFNKCKHSVLLHKWFFDYIYVPLWLPYKWFFHVFWHVLILYIYYKIVSPWVTWLLPRSLDNIRQNVSDVVKNFYIYFITQLLLNSLNRFKVFYLAPRIKKTWLFYRHTRPLLIVWSRRFCLAFAAYSCFYSFCILPFITNFD